MIPQNLRVVFWGLLLVAVDVQSHGLDLLPDLLGYLLLVAGLWKLAPVNRGFARAAPWAVAWGGVVLLQGLGGGDGFLPVAEGVATLLTYWFLCAGVAALDPAGETGPLARTAWGRRGLLAAMLAVDVGLVLAAWLTRAADPLRLAVPAVVLTLGAVALVAHLLWRAADELERVPGPAAHAP